MATGASTANLAIILIDAQHGVIEQTRRHSFIASLLDIHHIVVAVNKMDLVDYSEEIFGKIRADYADFASRLEVGSIDFIPISALRGDNVVEGSDAMPWYRGKPLLNYLETVHIASDRNLIDLRFPVQYALRPDRNFRGYLGTVASGIMRAGSDVRVVPSGKQSKIKSIVTFDGEVEEAFPPMAVTVTLEDEIDVSRGDMLVHPGNIPRISSEFEAVVVWMADTPMTANRPYRIKHTTSVTQAEVRRLEYRFDVNTLARENADQLELNEIGRVHIQTSRPLAFDPYSRNHSMGSFILIDPITNSTVGAGMILDRRTAEAITAPRGDRRATVSERRGSVSTAQRAERLRQLPATVWLTGLPKAGKSTVGYALEQRLYEAGHMVNVLDSSNLRLGISDDLGFLALERSENIRRAAHIAKLFNDTGMITVVTLVSPFEADRAAARDIIGADRFHEVHLNAPVEICEERDDEQLYQRARAGELEGFTGVSAPYEPPRDPALTLATGDLDVGDAVDCLVALLRDRGIIKG
jgi:bifunctional enzyme CysN/CysC